jgi:hypothetical protein
MNFIADENIFALMVESLRNNEYERRKFYGGAKGPA